MTKGYLMTESSGTLMTRHGLGREKEQKATMGRWEEQPIDMRVAAAG